MFDTIRNHQRWLQFILLLLILPSFAFIGLQGYSSLREGDHSLAKVAGGKVSQQEYDEAMRGQLDQLRATMGAQFDARAFDTPATRKAVLDEIINTRAIVAEADKAHFSASDNQLRQTILTIPAFQENGRFSNDRYVQALAAQGMTPVAFEAQLRRNVSVQQVLGPVAQSAAVPASVFDRVIAAATERRDVQTQRIAIDDYRDKVAVGDADVKAYYDAHQSEFAVPERVDAQYVVLDQAAISGGIQVSDSDVGSYYEQNKARFGQPEQRRASHILITVDAKASEAERAAALKKAQALDQQAKAPGADFAKLARQNSQDPGSAANGGDLDWFGRGMMVKQFEDAAFALKQGEVSDVVPTEYGFHIIKLTGIRPAQTKPLAEVRGQIVDEIRQQQAARQFADAAEQFTNLVYEQSDTLEPAASKFGLKIQTAQGVTRTAAPQDAEPLNNPKVLEALFSDDVLRDKRNSGAIELAPNRLVSVRVAKYEPASVLPLEQVSAQLRQRLIHDKAAELARQAGEEKLKALQAADATAGFGPVVTVARNAPQDMAPALLSAVMKAPADKLPAFVGADTGDAYVIARISKVSPAPALEAQVLSNEKSLMERRWAQAEQLAVLQTLRGKYKAQITEDGERVIAGQRE
ncbi:SurA N-terminal domain-containing protein [Pigmentiphaga soli]|uniref:Periplasmic chaperone PpiD n=1 Tax=Pigmentiphaga soli TaxID=1007095 RepID=A0ABP8HG48_9BURK